jgi:hypothetical protein
MSKLAYIEEKKCMATIHPETNAQLKVLPIVRPPLDAMPLQPSAAQLRDIGPPAASALPQTGQLALKTATSD